MFMLQCALEENCLASSAVNTSVSTGYRRLLRFSSQIHNNGQADFRPKSGRHAWIWHDCHRQAFGSYPPLSQIVKFEGTLPATKTQGWTEQISKFMQNVTSILVIGNG